MSTLLRVAIGLLAAVFVALLLSGGGIMGLQVFREAARRDRVRENQHQLQLALDNYQRSAGVAKVKLGQGDLLAGITGEGPLSLDEVNAWLDDPANHAVIQQVLPLGLAAGQGGVLGLEKNPLTRAKIELGRQLFFDTRLSVDNTVSCASCHAPDNGYASDTRFGVGIRSQQGARNSPAAYNRILSGPQFRDGRAATLEDQAVGPIENPIEMGHTHHACVAALAKVPGYRAQFQRVFPDGVTIENVGRAIASFERTLVTGPSPWDYYDALQRFEKSYADELEEPEFFAEEEPQLFAEHQRLKRESKLRPISASAIRGGELFFDGAVGCTQCHNGANFTDERYHNLGVGMDQPDQSKIDWGRYDVTKRDKDRGAFKTPTLRNVAQTAPYMHDGSQQTLEEVIEFYDAGGHPNPHLSDLVSELGLSQQEKADLVAFLKSLTGPLPNVEQGRLPE